MAKGKIYAIIRGCTGCGTCVYECPVGAIEMTIKGAVIDPDECTGCGACYENCASEAIEALEPETANKNAGEGK